MPENRQVVIASLPTGALAESDFELQTVGVPEPGPGQVLCRTLAVSVSAGSRAGLQGSASYAGAPKTGIVMSSLAVARVERSNDPALSPGDVVTCGAGWQDWSVHPAQQCFRVEGSAEPKPGDTVVVSAAAGSVGHLVGQIARIQGCRVVGVAGSTEKCQRLVAELGFDAAVNHRSPDFRQEFKAACGDGIDVYFDNTGGDVLGAALFRMRNGGRIACCGVVSQYDTSKPAPGPRGVPGLLVNKRLRMQGFLVFDWAQRYGEARAQLESWLDSGELVAWQDEFEGLESAPRALVDLLAGGNVGTRIVRVSQG
jgi:NADPH-dependent curcumin reductase CurA